MKLKKPLMNFYNILNIERSVANRTINQDD